MEQAMQRALKKQVKTTHKRHKLNSLQRLLARHEPVPEAGARIMTGFSDIDAYLTAHAGGGLPCGGVHEVAAAQAADMTAVLGFAHMLAARFMRQAAEDAVLLYGQTHAACRDGGQPYAPALAAHGLSPEKLVYLDGVTLPDLLWAGEQALACPSVACSVLTSSGAAPDFTHSRRLSLAARAVERPLLLALGTTGASAATTRWRIAALPRNGWHVTLEKLRLTYDTPPPAAGWEVYPALVRAPEKPTVMPLMRRAV
jgi:protein ImuA